MDDDPLYLKQYVKLHPNSKMGWYLLGKQYAQQGEEGKAKYCYSQAGDVYEAFETIRPPLEPPPHSLDNDASSAGTKRNSKRMARTLKYLLRRLVTMLLALLYLTYIPISDGNKNAEIAFVPDIYSTSEFEVFYTSKLSGPGDIKEALAKVVLPVAKKIKYAVIVKAPLNEDRHWILWQTPPTIILSAERSHETGQMDIKYYDAQSCACKPSDDSRAVSVVSAWTKQQEELAVLRSAQVSYQKVYGQAPASIEQLTRNYPNNVLPGYTTTMKEAFDAKELISNSPTSTVVPTLPVQPSSSGNNSVDKTVPADRKASVSIAEASNIGVTPLIAPLEIIVDKVSHRLALVSGNVIVRSYPVGLGGSRTPEGVFAISEKVRNPNGHANGDFGSRGMTLSEGLYAIHGTNQPSSIGKDRSLGCVRMLKEDLEELYDMTPIGTKVSIGKGNLPKETKRSEEPRFQLPLLREETNPGKKYTWLD